MAGSGPHSTANGAAFFRSYGSPVARHFTIDAELQAPLLPPEHAQRVVGAVLHWRLHGKSAILSVNIGLTIIKF